MIGFQLDLNPGPSDPLLLTRPLKPRLLKICTPSTCHRKIVDGHFEERRRAGFEPRCSLFAVILSSTGATAFDLEIVGRPLLPKIFLHRFLSDLSCVGNSSEIQAKLERLNAIMTEDWQQQPRLDPTKKMFQSHSKTTEISPHSLISSLNPQ